MGTILESTDAKNKLEDLSGVTIKPGENPYEALIKACNNNPMWRHRLEHCGQLKSEGQELTALKTEIQTLYSTHRVTRNAQQKEKFLSCDFKEVIIDPFLLRIERPEFAEPGFADPRYCLVFWARPPDHVIRLAAHLQTMLREAAPNLWLMPTHRMHMTTLEVTHSRTPEEIAPLVSTMRPTIPDLVNYTFSHRSRLVKPMLSYDLAAIAVSFLPAAGEPVVSPSPVPPVSDPRTNKGHIIDDSYTYHHLRRDVFDLAKSSGVEIGSRYVVPSAHITLGRYLGQDDHATPELRNKWIQTIDDINVWLQKEVWDNPNGKFTGEWIVGQERGLDARNGALWYGGGRSIMLGEGF